MVVGRRIDRVTVQHQRLIRPHLASTADFVSQLSGQVCTGTDRRGKFMWLSFESGDSLTIHLGMSGQIRIVDSDAPLHRHTRVVFSLSDGTQMRFLDQRMFGFTQFNPAADHLPGRQIPASICHIAPDVYDPQFDPVHLVSRIRGSSSGIKRLLLNQSVVSGIGNIYADEALWRARLHYDSVGDRLGEAAIYRLIDAIRDVMDAAIDQGGTSFDALYVNVNGESGYFDRSLTVYGQAGKPCRRCGTTIVRESFMNRSSFRCPSCQQRRRCATRKRER